MQCSFTIVQVGSEESVFEALLAWIQYSPSAREEHLPRLLQYVRLPLLSAKYITDVVDIEVACFIIFLLSLLCYCVIYSVIYFVVIWTSSSSLFGVHHQCVAPLAANSLHSGLSRAISIASS